MERLDRARPFPGLEGRHVCLAWSMARLAAYSHELLFRRDIRLGQYGHMAAKAPLCDRPLPPAAQWSEVRPVLPRSDEALALSGEIAHPQLHDPGGPIEAH